MIQKTSFFSIEKRYQKTFQKKTRKSVGNRPLCLKNSIQQKISQKFYELSLSGNQ